MKNNTFVLRFSVIPTDKGTIRFDLDFRVQERYKVTWCWKIYLPLTRVPSGSILTSVSKKGTKLPGVGKSISH